MFENWRLFRKGKWKLTDIKGENSNFHKVLNYTPIPFLLWQNLRGNKTAIFKCYKNHMVLFFFLLKSIFIAPQKKFILISKWEKKKSKPDRWGKKIFHRKENWRKINWRRKKKQLKAFACILIIVFKSELSPRSRKKKKK